jgi:large subunit ribosomal protein L23
VATDATKPEIAKAVEELFGVKVAAVNTINMKKKPKRVRYSTGYTAEWKKAVVTLKADSKTIEFFDGMN